jgi:hypothetical protein
VGLAFQLGRDSSGFQRTTGPQLGGGPGQPPTPPTPPPLPPTDYVSPDADQFQYHVGGAYPPQIADNPLAQAKQATLMARLTSAASISSLTKGLGPDGRQPPDFVVRQDLQELGTSPPDPSLGPVTTTSYTSDIPHVPPNIAYQHFVNDPNSVFGAGGVEIRPATSKLADGGRYMLEASSNPPTWLPIEVHLDPAQNQVAITTLNGHPLRGFQTFTFQDDGKNGTKVQQDAQFQISNGLVPIGTAVAAQHSLWRAAHNEMYSALANKYGIDPISPPPGVV